MPETKSIFVKDLTLDLFNFRTVPQPDDIHAVQAMISISPDRFWALMESLIDDGYLATENILVLKSGPNQSDMIVKEGNRRIAALKLILGHLPSSDTDIPENIRNKIKNLPSTWNNSNDHVPCTIYDEKDASVVDRIVTLAHGKGEKAGRDQWNTVARARHNRNFNKLAEPALDLLEKYLKQGKNLTHQQAERWAGEYPLSVLDEAIKKISTRFGLSSAPELAQKYPTISHRDALENIIRDVGVQIIGFQTIRKADMDFAAQYGLPPSTPSGNVPQVAPSVLTGGTSNLGQSPQSTVNLITQSGRTTRTAGKKVAAASASDPKSVMRTLKVFAPLGNNRQKVVALRDEARRLKLDRNPLAFCFLLRSMFEISAKLYCDDHKTTGGPSYSKATGEDRKLVDVLRDITAHLTNNSANKVMVKALHGAATELAKSDGILSVTSMNQLVHNPSFLITAHDISTLFGNIFPLLNAMNR